MDVAERIESFLIHQGVSEEEIEHSGVKGMKWGVRRARPSQTEVYNARASLGKAHDRLNRAKALPKNNFASAYRSGKIAKSKADIKEVNKVAKQAANGKERAARILAKTSIGLSLASAIVPTVTNSRRGDIASNILLGAAGATLAASLITNKISDKQESKFHQNS